MLQQVDRKPADAILGSAGRSTLSTLDRSWSRYDGTEAGTLHRREDKAVLVGNILGNMPSVVASRDA
jgi:hypothetical protein